MAVGAGEPERETTQREREREPSQPRAPAEPARCVTPTASPRLLFLSLSLSLSLLFPPHNRLSLPPNSHPHRQEVLDPRDLMKKARDELGAETEGEWRANQPSGSSAFAGAGQSLNGATTEGAPQPEQVRQHTITFWQNGFSVDDGPLRDAQASLAPHFSPTVTRPFSQTVTRPFPPHVTRHPAPPPPCIRTPRMRPS